MVIPLLFAEQWAEKSFCTLALLPVFRPLVGERKSNAAAAR
jgi:hypothetical protein